MKKKKKKRNVTPDLRAPNRIRDRGNHPRVPPSKGTPQRQKIERMAPAAVCYGLVGALGACCYMLQRQKITIFNP